MQIFEWYTSRNVCLGLLLKNQNMTVRFSHIDDADMFDFYTDLIWKKKEHINVNQISMKPAYMMLVFINFRCYFQVIPVKQKVPSNLSFRNFIMSNVMTFLRKKENVNIDNTKL